VVMAISGNVDSYNIETIWSVSRLCEVTETVFSSDLHKAVSCDHPRMRRYKDDDVELPMPVHGCPSSRQQSRGSMKLCRELSCIPSSRSSRSNVTSTVVSIASLLSDM
jgi:tRNA G10  N-methylase Trm11